MSTDEPGNRSGAGAASVVAHLQTGIGAHADPDAQALRSRFCILVVDDTPAARYALVRGLKTEGFSVVEASAGQDGIAMAPAADLVVVDLNLPDINGVQVCRAIKDLHPQRPVVLVSAVLIDEVHQAAGRSAGGDAFFESPPDPRALARTLEQLLRIRA